MLSRYFALDVARLIMLMMSNLPKARLVTFFSEKAFYLISTISEMTLCIRGSWHIDTKGSQVSSLPPSEDSKEIALPSSDLGDIIIATAELKKHINDQLTIWKNALEGQGDSGNVKEDEEQAAEEEEDE
jgi:hypothetical protein